MTHEVQVRTSQHQNSVLGRNRLQRPKSFIWIDRNGQDTPNSSTKCATTTTLSSESPNSRKCFVRRKEEVLYLESHESRKLTRKGNIAELLRVKRAMSRMNYTKLIKLGEIESLEKTAHETESRLKRAEKLLQEDEKTFDEFLRKYMLGTKEKEKKEKIARDEILTSRKELESRIRSLRLKISSIEQSIFQLEDMIHDQIQIKTLLSRNTPKFWGVEEDMKLELTLNGDVEVAESRAVQEKSDVTDFASDFLGFEDKNFYLMQQIQEKEIKLAELQRQLMRNKCA